MMLKDGKGIRLVMVVVWLLICQQYVVLLANNSIDVSCLLVARFSYKTISSSFQN